MASLTEAAYYTRKTIKYGAIALAVIIILRIAFNGAIVLWKQAHPPPPPEASVAFGKLPRSPFKAEEQKKLKFTLETVSGTTGQFSGLAKVYFMPEKRSGLLALDRAKELARKMNFIFEQEALGETVFEWKKDNPLPAKLRINTVTEHFKMQADWKVRPDLLASVAVAPSEAEAISIAKNWLSSLGYLPQDLSGGEAQVSYLAISGTEIVPALSRSDAQFVKVTLLRAGIEESKVWPHDLDKGLATITFIPGSQRGIEMVVVDAEYNYNVVEYDHNATYPLVSSQTAWEDLKAGKGHYYYSGNYDNQNTVAIRKISLGYYDPPLPGYYLQPIYVFEGDNDFTAYVEAVDRLWLQTEE